MSGMASGAVPMGEVLEEPQHESGGVDEEEDDEVVFVMEYKEEEEEEEQPRVSGGGVDDGVAPLDEREEVCGGDDGRGCTAGSGQHAGGDPGRRRSESPIADLRGLAPEDSLIKLALSLKPSAVSKKTWLRASTPERELMCKGDACTGKPSQPLHSSSAAFRMPEQQHVG